MLILWCFHDISLTKKKQNHGDTEKSPQEKIAIPMKKTLHHGNNPICSPKKFNPSRSNLTPSPNNLAEPSWKILLPPSGPPPRPATISTKPLKLNLNNLRKNCQHIQKNINHYRSNSNTSQNIGTLLKKSEYSTHWRIEGGGQGGLAPPP